MEDIKEIQITKIDKEYFDTLSEEQIIDLKFFRKQFKDKVVFHKYRGRHWILMEEHQMIGIGKGEIESMKKFDTEVDVEISEYMWASIRPFFGRTSKMLKRSGHPFTLCLNSGMMLYVAPKYMDNSSD